MVEATRLAFFPCPAGCVAVRLHCLPPLVLPCLVVEPLVVERVELRLESMDDAMVVLVEIDRPATEVALNLILPHERRLVDCTANLNDVNFTRISVLGLVVVADQENLGFFPTLVGFHDLLDRVRRGVG